MLRRASLKLLLSGSLALLGSVLLPVKVLAKWNKAAFTATDINAALAACFPGQTINRSEQIDIGVHPVVENGAVVPVKINTGLPNIESISIFVDKNPNPLIANFDLSPNCIGFVSSRIKVQEPSNIIAVVKTTAGVFKTQTFVEVHEAGCG